MANTKKLTRSFVGGELTPELYGNLALAKYDTGLALASNMICLPHGPAVRRPGFEFFQEANNSNFPVRNIPFEYSADQAVIVELGEQYAAFHTPEGTVLETARGITAITAASPAVFTDAGHSYVMGDWLFISGVTGPAALNGAFYKVASTTANTYTLARLDGVAISTVGLPPYTGGGSAGRVYKIASPYLAADLQNLKYVQSADVLTLTHPKYAARELRRLGATNWQFSVISFAPSAVVPTTVVVTPTVAVATNLTTQRYVVTAVGADGISESLASLQANATNNLTLQGNFNTVSWASVASATRYRVYKQRGGTFGYIGQTAGLSLVDDNILPDTSLSPPEDVIKLNTVAQTYPTAVTYHEQRRVFAGTEAKPQNILATRSGTESNLTSSLPSQESDGFEFRVASRQQNQIRHLVSFSDLLALTAGGEWRIYADNAPALTPTSLTVKPTGYSGANNVQPVLTSGSVLFIQAQGSRLRELSYGGAEANYGFKTIDLSIMAPHLFNNFFTLGLAYLRAPDQQAWAVRSDGKLLCLSYVPEQQVYAWSQHSTDGIVEDVCTLSRNGQDTLYLVVRRVVNGRTVRYIERMRQRVYASFSDAFFVDAGFTYSGAPVSELSNLFALEGRMVSVLANGAVEPQRTVVGGKITLQAPASKIQVGLPYTSRLQSLPLSIDTAVAAGQGVQRNVNSVALRVTDSNAIRAGRSFSKLREYAARDVADVTTQAPSLVSDEVTITIDGKWDSNAQVCVEQSLPLPLNILSMTLEVSLGG